MNWLNGVEDFFLNKLAGKLLARAAVTLAGVLVGIAAKGHITLDPLEVQAALVLGGQALFELVKHWRLGKAEAPKVEAPTQ